MTREEAKKRLEVWLICGECPEDKQCYDSHLHSTCEYTDYCDEVSLTNAVKVAILALSENKGEWIPANVPPKESGRYLTYIVNEYDEKLQYIMTADYIARPTPIEGLSPWYVDDECASDNVVAWQPLPEPYKEGGNK